MTEENKTDKLSSMGTNRDDKPASPGRRRFTKVGLAAPVILSLSSRPVWGKACSLSALLSGNLSGHHDDMVCGGCTPGYWGQHSSSWPGGTSGNPGTCLTTLQGAGSCQNNAWGDDGTKFHTVFDGGQFGDLTMMQVIHLNGNEDPFQVGQHTVAAFLNALHPNMDGIYPLDNPNDVITYWNDNYMGDLQEVKEFFQYMNELGCPLANFN